MPDTRLAARRFRRPQLVEPVVGVAVCLALLKLGYTGSAPWWLVISLVMVYNVQQQPAVQAWLSGGEPRGRLWLRVSLHISVAATMASTFGWGPPFGTAALLVVSLHLIGA